MADKFIEIAVKRPVNWDGEELLIEPQPIAYERKTCVLEPASKAPYLTKKKMDTQDELEEELKSMRKKYAPYLENNAPPVKNYRERIDINEFLLDGKETVTIPHYGGPLGDGTQIYEADFDLKDFDGRAVYICFRAADYIANVYVNDICVGIHEGFFSPFEFEITKHARKGINKLKVILENDFPLGGEGRGGEKDPEKYQGDKLYAATGIGYDDPEIGWHHCPPGMGIYDKVYVEIRNKMSITDIFVRPVMDKSVAELWIELENAEYSKPKIAFDISLYGQNFKQTVFEHISHSPMVGNKDLIPEHGKNVFKIPITIKNPKIWTLDTPYLYQIQVGVSVDDNITDIKTAQFGMRSFTQDQESDIKGKFYLNGNEIRLRGANTMGFEQQDVANGNFKQLIDDILLAKICNMNFWRITQRPVQDEVYQYCDMLGLMTQTDLPLFSFVRRTKVPEGIRQAEEMAKIVRKHPCNIMVTYMNEPTVNDYYLLEGKYGIAGVHRHLSRDESEGFYSACDYVVTLNHPDCVIKHIDGDYVPPDKTGKNCMPDNHCYTLWYSGFPIQFQKIHKGYWQKVLPNWCYGCGEFGAEGMDFVDLMKRRYPKEWIKEPFDPGNIICAQAKGSHFHFMDTPDTMEEWVNSTQRHQAYSAKMLTEAFRRDPRMVSFALHLFIDAWPAGWMKAIMDCERRAKPAYFAYRNALEPVMVNLRSDRFSYYEGETASIEAYVCNDTNDIGSSEYNMVFELYDGDKLIMQKEIESGFDANTCTYIANAEFITPHVDDRKTLTLKAILVKDGEASAYNTFDLEVFEKREPSPVSDDVVLLTDLDVGEHEIAGETVKVEDASGGSDIFRLFVSRKTGHKAVDEFREFDFFMWYDKEKDMIMPIAPKKFTAEGFTPILIGEGAYNNTMVAGVKEYEGKKYVISFLDARCENPVAERFMNNLRSL